jgi:phosphoglycerate dehydrogenase-like enzyme
MLLRVRQNPRKIRRHALWTKPDQGSHQRLADLTTLLAYSRRKPTSTSAATSMNPQALRIVFHGPNASQFRPGMEELIGPGHEIQTLSDRLDGPGERAVFEAADVIVGVRLQADLPRPLALRLYLAPAAGTDAIDATLLPQGCPLCNCFGHENAIAEYVMAALLARHVPLMKADADLRQQRWTYWAGAPDALRTELGGQTLGVIGLGHIGRTLAERAKAFGMRVHACNRSPVAHPCVDQTWPLSDLVQFMGAADAIVLTLPLNEQTRGLVGHQALAAMRPDAAALVAASGVRSPMLMASPAKPA